MLLGSLVHLILCPLEITLWDHTRDHSQRLLQVYWWHICSARCSNTYTSVYSSRLRYGSQYMFDSLAPQRLLSETTPKTTPGILVTYMLSNILQLAPVYCSRLRVSSILKVWVPYMLLDSLARLLRPLPSGCLLVGRPTQLIYISDIYLLSWWWEPPIYRGGVNEMRLPHTRWSTQKYKYEWQRSSSWAIN